MANPESEFKIIRKLKGLYTIACVNTGIWALALIALAILIQKGGNIKGMYVILAAGVITGIQIIALVAKLKGKET
ncbi:MAG TPA: hypothetical protein PLV45_04270 [bacterium]|nr:hypothetical protein [bacterium]